MSTSTGYFQIGRKKTERLTAQQFGYWSLRWATDNVAAAIQRFKSPQHSGARYAAEFSEGEYYLKLQLLALYGAIYWVYAISTPEVTASTRDNMNVGFSDSVKDLRNPLGNTLSAVEENYFLASFNIYIESILADMSAAGDHDLGVFRPEVSKVSVAFFENIAIAYPKLSSTTALDRLSLSHNIAEIPLIMFKALDSEIGLEYFP